MQGVGEHLLCDGAVSGDKAKHCAHIGMDHAGAFGYGPDGDSLSPHHAGDRQLLFHGIRGHNGVGGRVGAILRELCRRLGQPLLNGGDVQFLTDDAGGCHHKIAGLQTRGCGGQLTHPLCVLMAVGGAGVGIAGIGHDALGLSVFQMVHGDIQRGRLHPVEGVHGGGGALPL